MTRSSRHKSSKHSSRDAREYSDSDKDLVLKDRKSKDESGGGVRVSKELGSSEKRKLDLKDGNGEYSEDVLVSTKRRKERVEDGGVSDRWNGGEYDHGSKKSVKSSGESKSKRRDESVEMYGEVSEVKKNSSSGKGEGKHRDRDREKDKDSSRKEGKEGGGGVEKEKDRDREKKSKEGRSERLVSVAADDQRVVAKQVIEITDVNGRKEIESPEPDNQIERRMRKRRDEAGDGDKLLEYVEDISGGRLSSRDELSREGRQKDEKRKDERYKEKIQEDMDRDNKHRDDKQRDERSTKDHFSSKSDDKHLKKEKDIIDMQQKRSKLQDSERKGEHERDRNRDFDSYHVRDREQYHDREREHGWDHGRDRDRDYDRDWDWDREREGDRDRERNHDRERARDRDRDGDRDRDYDHDYDGSHLDDRSTRYKDSSRGKRRSPDDRDDSTDTKSRGVKARYSDLEKKSSSGDRVESDVNKGRSQSRQAYGDTVLSSNKRRTSPSSNSNAGVDEYRYSNQEDPKYRDSVAEQRSKALPPRDVSGLSGSKYRSGEKVSKMDDGHLGEPLNEKPSGSKASPMALMVRSPSSSSIDRRYMNKTAVRRSIDIEETGRRSSSSMDNRDFASTEDRPGRELPLEKPDSSPADSSAHNRSSQSNFSSSFVPHPNFRAGVESPSFAGSVEEDGRVNSRFRRSSDPNLVRTPWRGVPNWPSPVPNGFMPFPHGGPHGGFQGMLPQFPAPPFFGVRPSMDLNPYAIPYQIPDDRLSNHLRPLGSQNIMEGLGPSHMHPWDGSTGAYRDDSNSYGAEWDPNRHPMNARGWDPNAEPWKAHNNDSKRDLPSPSPRNDYPVQTPVDDAVVGQLGQMSHHEENLDLGVHAKVVESRSTVASPMKGSTPITHEKSSDGSKSPIDNVPSLSRYYLSKLDISAELAHTELYSECLNILDTKGSAIDEDITMHTILKGGATTGLKSSKSLLCSSIFPPLKESVFQKAMELYKKQRMEARGIPFVAGGRLDIILASNQKIMEPIVCEVETVEQIEKPDVPVSSSDVNIALVTVSMDGVEDKLKELVPTPSHEMQNHVILGTPNLEMAVEDSTLEAEEPQAIPNGVEMDSESAYQVKVEVDDADGSSILDNKASVYATTTSPAVDDGMSEIKDDHSLHQAEEGGAVDAVMGPLVIPDGSPKACETLMSGSNESDSVILSRIHPFPESTH